MNYLVLLTAQGLLNFPVLLNAQGLLTAQGLLNFPVLLCAQGLLNCSGPVKLLRVCKCPGSIKPLCLIVIEDSIHLGSCGQVACE